MRQILKHPVMKHPLVYIAVLLLVSIIVVIPIAALASTPIITEYSMPSATSQPWNIAPGPDGNLWFTEKIGNKVGYINPTTKNITEFSLSQIDPPGYNYPEGITTGPDGNMWVADENSGEISKITAAGVITNYTLPNNLHPISIVTGPDSNLWFANNYNNTIGVMNTSGTVLHQYVLGTSPVDISGEEWIVGPMGISVGPDGNIWFAEQDTDTASTIDDEIVKMNPATGAVTDYPVNAIPTDTVAGPDGSVWFTLYDSNEFGKVNPTTGAVTYYHYPGTISTQTAWDGNYITEGPDGNMWISIPFTGIASVNPQTGSTTVYSTINILSGPWGIASGPDKNIWYTVSGNYSHIGEANIGLSTSSTTTGTDCKTVPSTDNSSSECSATAPGQAVNNSGSSPKKDSTPMIVSSSTASNGISSVVYSNGTTVDLVAPTLRLIYDSVTVPPDEILVVDGTLGTATIAGGGTVKGTGIITNLILENGGVLAPGHSPGCLTDNTLNMSGTYDADIAGTTACTSYDQVDVKDAVTINGKLQVNFSNGFKPKPGQTFTLIKNDGNSPVHGTFTDYPEGSIVVANDAAFTISYKGGDGNDVVLKTIEPNPADSQPEGHINKMMSQSFGSRLVSNVKKHSAAILCILIGALIIVSAGIFYLVKKHAKSALQAEKPTDAEIKAGK